MASTCRACTALAPMGIRCNAHRTQARSTEIVRKARAAGHDVADSDWKTAETALGAKPVRMN